MLYKRCSGCGKKIPSNDICECQVHNARERYKDYNAKRNDKDEQRFYRSVEWTRCKELRQIELIHIDWYEYYTKGNIVQGYMRFTYDILHRKICMYILLMKYLLI